MEENQKEIQLLNSVNELFMKFGIKSLTMDDISTQLGVSKKTLYLYVKDKKDLVCKVVNLMIQEEQDYVCGVAEESKTAIDELIGITKCMSERLGEIHPSVIYDIQKYHTEGWAIIEKHKTEFIYKVMLTNLKRGISEGFYRKNLNPEVVAGIYITMVDSAMNPDNPMSKKMTLENIMLEVISYHLNGISNEKGIIYLKEALKKEQDNKLSVD